MRASCWRLRGVLNRGRGLDFLFRVGRSHLEMWTVFLDPYRYYEDFSDEEKAGEMSSSSG